MSQYVRCDYCGTLSDLPLDQQRAFQESLHTSICSECLVHNIHHLFRGYDVQEDFHGDGCSLEVLQACHICRRPLTHTAVDNCQCDACQVIEGKISEPSKYVQEEFFEEFTLSLEISREQRAHLSAQPQLWDLIDSEDA